MNLGFFQPIQYFKHKNMVQAGASFDFFCSNPCSYYHQQKNGNGRLP